MIKIIADTLSCISPEEAKTLGIYYLPQLVIFGDETYRDDTEMDPITFLKRLRVSQALPKTAAPPPQLYTPIFQEISDNGDTGIVICPSGEASGTYRSAVVAAQDFPGADIRIIDTKLLAVGLGSVVRQAVRWVADNMDAKTLVTSIEEMSSRNQIYFVVDTLEYLYKGGRIGAAKALFGSLLQVKPILTFRNGHTEPFESQRTHKRAIARLKEVVLQACPREEDGHLALMHGDAEAEAREIAADLCRMLDIPVTSVAVADVTPAILVHSGPGVIGVSYFTRKSA